MPMPERTINQPFSLQERVLANGALHNLGDVATRYTIDRGGDRIFPSSISHTDPTVLYERFRKDPKTSLAFMRDNLFAVAHDKKVSEHTRHDRLSRYLDSYTSLTVKLDRAVFSDDGTVHEGVPDYIPDGLIDMGQDRNIDPRYRNREQILIDKAAIYTKYKKTLMDIFSSDIEGVSNSTMKGQIVTRLLLEVFREMPYNHQFDSRENNADVMPLHQLDNGVCRHIALTYQALAQACGLTSRLVKCHVNNVAHSMSATRINGLWFITDPTIPDYTTRPDGTKEWRPGVHRLGYEEPKPGDAYTVQARHSGAITHVVLRDNMYWRIANNEQ